jgi:hypothetical protein
MRQWYPPTAHARKVLKVQTKAGPPAYDGWRNLESSTTFSRIAPLDVWDLGFRVAERFSLQRLRSKLLHNGLSGVDNMGWNPKFLPLKLSFVLPIVQVGLAVFLLNSDTGTHPSQKWDTLYTPTFRLVCAGINAPATIFIGFGRMFDRVDHPQPTIFGLSLEFVFFLVGIALLWYVVGNLLDRRLMSNGPPRVWSKRKLTILGGALAVYGVFFFYIGLQGLLTPWRWNNYWGNIAHSSLSLVWSVVLLGIPFVKFVQRRGSID